jgi:hypothetical protein
MYRVQLKLGGKICNASAMGADTTVCRTCLSD